MPDETRRADALRVYLTGAVSDGGAQADPDLSLGNYRSSSLALALGVEVRRPIPGVQVDFVAGANGAGIGSLAAVDADRLAWTPPDGDQGEPVAIADGETKVLEADGDPDAYVRVTRSGAADLSGTADLVLAPRLNGVLGFDNVSSGEASAGDDEYRCLCLKNEAARRLEDLAVWIETLADQQVSDAGQLGAAGAGTLETTGSFAGWPDSGWCHIRTAAGATREIVYYSARTETVLTVPAAGRERLGTTAAAGAADDTLDAVPGIRLGQEAPSAQPDGHFSVPADEDTPPAGVASWSAGLSAATGLVVGALAPGEIVALWVHREIPASCVARPVVEHRLAWSFQAY